MRPTLLGAVPRVPRLLQGSPKQDFSPVHNRYRDLAITLGIRKVTTNSDSQTPTYVLSRRTTTAARLRDGLLGAGLQVPVAWESSHKQEGGPIFTFRRLKVYFGRSSRYRSLVEEADHVWLFADLLKPGDTHPHMLVQGIADPNWPCNRLGIYMLFREEVEVEAKDRPRRWLHVAGERNGMKANSIVDVLDGRDVPYTQSQPHRLVRVHNTYVYTTPEHTIADGVSNEEVTRAVNDPKTPSELLRVHLKALNAQNKRLRVLNKSLRALVDSLMTESKHRSIRDQLEKASGEATAPATIASHIQDNAMNDSNELSRV